MFRVDDIICILKKKETESIEQYIERGNFIAKSKPKNSNEYKKAVLYSNIHINIIHLGCEYDKKVMDRYEKYIS